MTETAEAKLTLAQEFKALTPKQLIAIIVAFATSIMLTVVGFAMSMLGFLIIAVLLYMLPHMMGVTSPKIKSIIGAVFIVALLLIAAFAYADAARDVSAVSKNNTELKEVSVEDDVIIIVCDNPSLTVNGKIYRMTAMAFGVPLQPEESTAVEFTFAYADGKYTAAPPMDAGNYYYVSVECQVTEDQKDLCAFLINNGISANDVMMMNLSGSIIVIVEIMLVFYIMLVFSELMRRSARKKRAQMEKDGRLYPAGYSRCKKCGAIILPGEINCRKCGEPIDVPDEIKVLHKKDFFECSECGTEVPMDAKVCPKCGAVFDEETETEVTHVDGSVSVSKETFECSECGKEVPANAKRCPFCGAEFDEDE